MSTTIGHGMGLSSTMGRILEARIRWCLVEDPEANGGRGFSGTQGASSLGFSGARRIFLLTGLNCGLDSSAWFSRSNALRLKTIKPFASWLDESSGISAVVDGQEYCGGPPR